MSGESDDYDEFGMLGDNAAEAGLTLSSLPPVTRASFTLAGGQVVSQAAGHVVCDHVLGPGYVVRGHGHAARHRLQHH